MRILHVITGLHTGGAEITLLKLLGHLKTEFESAVVCLGRRTTLSDQISGLGIPVHHLGWRPPVINPFRALSVQALTRNFRPDLIQGWMPHGNLIATLASRAGKTPLPVLWNVRMSVYDLRTLPWPTAKAIRLGAVLSRRPSKVIYNSQVGARQHEALGYDPTKRVVIPNGFDCEKLCPDVEARAQLRTEWGVGEQDVVIGLIARFHPMKDHLGFFRAAQQVVRTYPSTRLLLTGPGITPDQPVLRQMIGDYGLHDRTILLGERNDIARINAAFDIACSSSVWGEGFSNAVGEAMACGVPCVVTDIGDSAFVVSDTGIAVQPRNPEALGDALIRLIEAGAVARQKLGNAARLRIQENFSLPAVLKRYEDLYREQIAAPQAR